MTIFTDIAAVVMVLMVFAAMAVSSAVAAGAPRSLVARPGHRGAPPGASHRG
jgi:hypothetical protein